MRGRLFFTYARLPVAYQLPINGLRMDYEVDLDFSANSG